MNGPFRAGIAGFAAALLVGGVARAAPAITKGPWVQRVTSTSAVIRVEVDPPSAVSIELEDTGEGGAHRAIPDDGVRALHDIRLTDLKPGTRYAYDVKVAAVSRLASFVTAPADGAEAMYRFIIYGDNRSDDAAHAAIVRAMTPVASDFLLHTGDFVANGGSSALWQTFFEIEAPLLGTRALFSCVGNHELIDNGGIEYARLFGPIDVPPPNDRGKNAPVLRPEQLDGTFRWGNARFFLLNGNVGSQPAVERAWLEKALDSSDREAGLVWRVLVVHHGPWSSGPHGGNARLHDAGIPALLKAHKVDLVVSGHDHIYERGIADGMPYVVSGGGGAPEYKVKAKIPQSRRVEATRHFIEVTVSAHAMLLEATRPDGSVIERCALDKKVAGWDCDGTPSDAASSTHAASAASTEHASTSTASVASGPAAQGSRCGCRAVGGERARPAHLLAALLALALAFVERRRRRVLG